MNSTPSGDSPSRNSSDQQRSPRRSPSTIRRSFLSHTTPYDTQGASPSPASTDIEPRPRSQGPGTDLRDYTETAERGSSRHGAERSSPSLSSSQGDMADTEMEAGPSQSSHAPQPTASPPKKKRTRTLTTPHQSAVLHALLAQSRFPTTAMREEVGRAIGLSARKVQFADLVSEPAPEGEASSWTGYDSSYETSSIWPLSERASGLVIQRHGRFLWHLRTRSHVLRESSSAP